MNTRRITKIIIGVVVLGTATAYFLYEAVESSWVYYYSVDEFVESQSARISPPFLLSPAASSCPPPRLASGDAGAEATKIDDNRIIRIAGRVKEGTIVRNAEKMQLDFELAGQKSSVAVRFYGAAPKNFAANKEVVVEGKVGSSEVFQANKILTRCESKYKVRL